MYRMRKATVVSATATKSRRTHQRQSKGRAGRRAGRGGCSRRGTAGPPSNSSSRPTTCSSRGTALTSGGSGGGLAGELGADLAQGADGVLAGALADWVGGVAGLTVDLGEAFERRAAHLVSREQPGHQLGRAVT